MATAATAFATSLNAEQKKRALWSFDDQSRTDWHFIPKDRAGLPIKEMDEKQRKLAHDLLKTGLSETGYSKATQIMELESVLREMEKDPIKRDPEKYHFWIFGTPSPKGTWGWKVEGHHLAFHFTVIKGTTVATTPAFMGANPAEVREGALKGRRVLKAEEDMGRDLLLSFDEKVRSKVIFDVKAPADILTVANSKVDPLPKAGMAFKAMNRVQKAKLKKLLIEYAANMPAKLGAERLAKIDKSGWDTIEFAWAGGIAKGDPHYYRIQGPTFLVEYDCTQTNSNHIHAVWRDFAGDFGRDLLRDHVKAAH